MKNESYVHKHTQVFFLDEGWSRCPSNLTWANKETGYITVQAKEDIDIDLVSF